MLLPSELKEYGCYFRIGFYDTELKFPLIETYVYIGKNILTDNSAEDLWYFQDAASYTKGGDFRNNPPSDETDIIRVNLASLETFTTIQNFVDELAPEF